MKPGTPEHRRIRNYDKHAAIIEHHEFHEPEKPERHQNGLFPLVGTKTLMAIFGIIMVMASLLGLLGLTQSQSPQSSTNILGDGDNNSESHTQLAGDDEFVERFIPSFFSQFLPNQNQAAQKPTETPTNSDDELLLVTDEQIEESTTQSTTTETLTNKKGKAPRITHIFKDADTDSSKSPFLPANTVATSSDTDSTEPVKPDSWSTYTDEVLGISFEYPSDWAVDQQEPGSVVFGDQVHYSSLWNQPTLEKAQEQLNYIGWDIQKLVRIETEYEQQPTPAVTFARWNVIPGSDLSTALCPTGTTVDRFAAHIDGTDSVVTFSIPDTLCLDEDEKTLREEIMEHMASHIRVIADPQATPSERVISKQKEAQIASLAVSITLHHDETGHCPQAKEALRDGMYQFFDELTYSLSPDETSCHIGLPIQETTALADDSDFTSTTWVNGFSGSDEQGCSGEFGVACYDLKLPL